MALQNQIYWKQSPDQTILDHSSHHTRGLSESKSPQDLEQFYFPVLNDVCSETWEESCELETPGAFPLTFFPRMGQVTLSHRDGIIPFLSLGPWFGLSAHFRLGRDIFFPSFLPRKHNQIIQNHYIKKMMMHKPAAHSTNNKNR